MKSLKLIFSLFTFILVFSLVGWVATLERDGNWRYMKYSTELKWYVILDKSDAEYAHLEQWLKKPRVWTPSIVSYAPTGWKISTDKYTLQVMKDLVVMNKRSGGQYTCKSDEEIVEIMRQLEKNVQNPSEK